nr:diguanylate cyclase [uncultured Pseudomonas sp.]
MLLALLQRRRQLEQQRALLEALPHGVLLVDGDGCIRLHNAAAARLLGQSKTGLAGTALQQWLPQFNPHASEHLQCTLTIEGRQQVLEVNRRATAQHGDVIVLTQAPALQNNPAEDAERFKRSQYFASMGTWDWSIDTEKLYWSEAIYGMFGFKPGEVTPSYELFCSSVHPDDRERVRAGEQRCIETGQNHDEEYRVVWPDGSIRWLRETGNVIKDANGQPTRMMGVVRDITDEKASVSQLQRLARHDPLTGLPNRLQLEEFLTQALARARTRGTRVALVFIDLNGFKQINDMHGHAIGDRLLVSLAERLRQTLRESDLLARLGGDEFVGVIEGLSLSRSLHEDTRTIGEKLLLPLTQPIDLGDLSLKVGASLGIAMFPEHGPNTDSLIHVADQAMYAAKRSGNSEYCLGVTNLGEQLTPSDVS